MSSTPFNVGLKEDTRPSSRVLRPPGGGHTDIFGGPDAQPVKRDMGRNASSILEGTNVNNVVPSPVKNTAAPLQPREASKPPPTQQAQRSKVPPGGFSSGLW